ncbi:MAG: hypothetical protein AB8I08_33755 [Sandaracinaceae bacterium]
MNDSVLRIRLVCGLLASAARLVPVPFLDDFLREKAGHVLVSQTLQAHGRTYRSKEVAPLYTDSMGCLHGCLLGAVTGVFKLITYPVKKFVVYVMAAKWLARDLAEAVLLGRAMDRALSAGQLRDDGDKAARHMEADRLRKAFDNAVAGTDMKLLRTVIDGTVVSIGGLPRAAFAALKGLRRQDADAVTDPSEGLSAANEAKVAEGTDRLAAALDTEDMRAFLQAFDQRLDENLRILSARG